MRKDANKMQQTNQGHTAAVNSNPNPNPRFKILPGNALFELQSVKAESIDTVFTSPEPPYNYQQLEELEQILLQLPRVVKQTGSIWVNMGDVHNDDGVLALIPQRLVYDMVVEHGWQLRSEERRVGKEWRCRWVVWCVRDRSAVQRIGLFV